MNVSPKFYPGDKVRVRSFEEILATLDAAGTCEGLPFMPEMKSFCGREWTVRHRLEKTCVEGYGARLLPNTVTLEGVYCDGSCHGGCERCCPLLWKEAWLKALGLVAEAPSSNSARGAAAGSSPELVTKRDDRHYFCQSTELGRATKYLFPITLTRCTAEWRSRNVALHTALRYLWIPFVIKVKSKLFGIASVQPVGQMDKTPAANLDLQPGELVQVKTPQEIALTLDRKGRNRGLAFTPQMLPFCGRQYRVKGRVQRAILETTGQMRELRHTVILEGATCDGHTILGGCSRHVYHLWREIWLRRALEQRDEG